MKDPSNLIDRFEHLANRPHAERAREMILKTASLVKPIMKAHGWTVGTLAEFLPDNPSLLGLNVNAGQKILLRLRPPHSPDTFYEQEQITLVMLHELTHNKFGPHDDKFYALLKELEKEWDDLKSKGYTGEGFLSNGARLGGSHPVPTHIGRIKGLEAAEKRVQRQIMLGKGGVLGGAAGAAGVGGKGRGSPREMALLAAERRIKDQKSCGRDQASAQEESRKAAAQSVGTDAVDLTEGEKGGESGSTGGAGLGDTKEGGSGAIGKGAAPPPVMDLTIDSDEEERGVGTPSSSIKPLALAHTAAKAVNLTRSRSSDSKVEIQLGRNAQASGSSSSRAAPSRLIATSRPKPFTTGTHASIPPQQPSGAPTTSLRPTTGSLVPPPSTSRIWSCPTCTLDNPLTARRCEACDTIKPRDPGEVDPEGWWCHACGGFGNRHEFWSCRTCGGIKKG